MTTKEIIDGYYKAWVENDRERARSFLCDDLKFRSPKDNFDSADQFMDACWKFAEPFKQFKVIHEVYDDQAGYVVYDGLEFVAGEFIRIRDGKIAEIYVTFNPTY